MTKAKTMKIRGSLREYTDLAPKAKANTRWTGTCIMINRYFYLVKVTHVSYFKLEEHLVEEPDLKNFLLNKMEKKTLEGLVQPARDFLSIMVALQRASLTMGQVRKLFDGVIEKYPSM